MSYCEKCDKTFSSRQSLWKHRQRKHQGQNDTVRSIIVNNAIQKANMDTNPMMNITLRKAPNPMVKDVPAPIEGVKAKSFTNLPMKIDFKSDSEPESDNDESESTEESDPEFSEDIESMPDNLEELKAAFRNLYRKVHNNTKNYNKLVLMLDKLQHMNCLTREECNGVKGHFQEKIGIA